MIVIKGPTSWTADASNLENETEFSQWDMGLFIDIEMTDDEMLVAWEQWMFQD